MEICGPQHVQLVFSHTLPQGGVEWGGGGGGIDTDLLVGLILHKVRFFFFVAIVTSLSLSLSLFLFLLGLCYSSLWSCDVRNTAGGSSFCRKAPQSELARGGDTSQHCAIKLHHVVLGQQ